MPITKTGSTIEKVGGDWIVNTLKNPESWRKGWGFTKGLGKGLYWGVKGVGNVAESAIRGAGKATKHTFKFMKDNPVASNVIMGGGLVAGVGAYNLPRKAKANMIHIDPNSKNYLVNTFKGYEFASPKVWNQVKNTDMLY